MIHVRIASRHMPISINRAYRNATAKDRVKGRIKTKYYGTWLQAVGWDIRAAMVHQKPIKGAYTIEIGISRVLRHPLADVENFAKTTVDALQEFGVIENDRFCERLSIGWEDLQDGVAFAVEVRTYFKPL